jgi:hypothetical protein
MYLLFIVSMSFPSDKNFDLSRGYLVSITTPAIGDFATRSPVGSEDFPDAV